jgi:hypothetical protein
MVRLCDRGDSKSDLKGVSRNPYPVSLDGVF